MDNPARRTRRNMRFNKSASKAADKLLPRDSWHAACEQAVKFGTRVRYGKDPVDRLAVPIAATTIQLEVLDHGTEE